MPPKPKAYHRSNAELRTEIVELARLVSDLASWSELPPLPDHWYVKALRTRVNRATGMRNSRSA
jgi:hypothetical protein